MSTYNEEDKRIGYWKLEAFPDHIDRRRCKMIMRRCPHKMRKWDINTQIKVVDSNSNVKLERRQTSINIIKNLS